MGELAQLASQIELASPAHPRELAGPSGEGCGTPSPGPALRDIKFTKDRTSIPYGFKWKTRTATIYDDFTILLGKWDFKGLHIK